MPGLALELRRLDEQHRLHAFDAAIPVRQVGGRDLRQHAADQRMLDVFEHHVADEVRLMNAENVLKHLLVRHRVRQGLEVFARVSAAGELDGVSPQLLDFVHADQARHHEKAIVDEAFHLRRRGGPGHFNRVAGELIFRRERLSGHGKAPGAVFGLTVHYSVVPEGPRAGGQGPRVGGDIGEPPSVMADTGEMQASIASTDSVVPSPVVISMRLIGSGIVGSVAAPQARPRLGWWLR